MCQLAITTLSDENYKSDNCREDKEAWKRDINQPEKGQAREGDEKEATAWIIQREKVVSIPATRGIQTEAKTLSPRNTGGNS